MDKLIKDLPSLTPLLWPLLAFIFVLAYHNPIRRFFYSVVRRIERGDEVRISTWLTLGVSTGRLKVPAIEGLVTDDHVALIHRSWRVPKRDEEFPGQKMFQIHVILYGQPEALNRVEYVFYRLDSSYPNPVRCTGDRKESFDLKELANGHSLIRAEVKIKEQEEIIYLSRFIDLTDESPRLKGTYL
jgi:hypothetical protein